MAKKPKLTAWDKARIVGLELKGAKRAAAGITESPDLDRRVERIHERARKRANGSK